ncbi:MAG: tellurium resistance protein TerC [Candidatus Rokuibacteriota bacterium]|nr:MAG: tellurium resistance protein TerC [Candidatus Rokubacteria bacterium]
MASLLDLEFWARWVGIVFTNLLLSGDNALVIALAVRRLPRHQRLLGQIWGTVGALALRLAFIAIVSFLLTVALLQFAGGLLLIWIAWKLVRQETGVEAEERHGASFWEAIWIIIVADVTMSLDNVLAIAGLARGDLRLIVFGIALSMPLVVLGASVLAWLMNRYVWIVWIGGGILGFVAGEMILKDRIIVGRLGQALADLLDRFLPSALGVLMTVIGWWVARGGGAPRR